MCRYSNRVKPAVWHSDLIVNLTCCMWASVQPEVSTSLPKTGCLTPIESHKKSLGYRAGLVLLLSLPLEQFHCQLEASNVTCSSPLFVCPSSLFGSPSCLFVVFKRMFVPLFFVSAGLYSARVSIYGLCCNLGRVLPKPAQVNSRGLAFNLCQGSQQILSLLAPPPPVLRNGPQEPSLPPK